MTNDEIIKEIIDNIPQNILEISESLQNQGVNKEMKLCYYLYKELAKRMLEADIEFHIADSYEQKLVFFRKDIDQLTSNKVLCKHINQLYKKLIEKAVHRYKADNIDLNIGAEIEVLHPNNEISHSDTIVNCNRKMIYCNPILDLLESKANYRINYFARDLDGRRNEEYNERLLKKYGHFFI